MKIEKHTIIKRVAVTAGCAVLLLASVACSNAGSAERNTAPVEGGNKSAVVDESRKEAGHEIKVEHYDMLEDIIGVGWLSDERIMTETIQVTPRGEGEEPVVSQSMAIRNLQTEEETPWQAGTGVVWLSPDGKHAFVAVSEGDKYKLAGKIVNIETGESVAVELEPGMIVGNWADNQKVIVATQSGKIVQIDTQGKQTPMPFKDDAEVILDVAQRGDAVYYLDGEGKLKSFSGDGNLVLPLASKVVEFEVSADGKHIAVVTNASESERTLKLIRPDGAEIGTTVAQGTLIERVAWSPDGTKLAFAVYSEADRGMKGVYVMDTAAGKVVPIFDFLNIQYPFHWSPSSTQLMVTVGNGDSSGEGQSTYLITFS